MFTAQDLISNETVGLPAEEELISAEPPTEEELISLTKRIDNLGIDPALKPHLLKSILKTKGL